MSRHVACAGSFALYWAAATAAITCLPTPAGAATRAEKTRQAEQLVREALAHESLGLAETRQRLLESAATLAPDYAPAQWHRGRVRIGNQWVAVDDALETDGQRRVRERYEQRRARAADTAADQWALAQWCAARRLPLQETAHLNRVIQLEPNHVTARQRLWQLGGGGVAGADLWEAWRDENRARAAIAKWRASLLRAAALAGAEDGTRLAAQRQTLLDELDAEAIPAVEAVLAAHSEAAACVAIQTLAAMPGHAASAALARMAVVSPWATIRDLAADELKSRPYDHYVPLLLTELSTPVDARLDAALIGGQMLFRQEFEQEFQDRREMLVLDTVLQRRASLVRTSAFGGWIPNLRLAADAIATTEAETRARALADMQQTLVGRAQRLLQRNYWILEWNDRIGQTLRAATGQNLAPVPEVWWSWWDEENDVTLVGKATDLRYDQEVRVYEDRVPPLITAESLRGSGASGMRRECFVAGTPVWTVSGPAEIERIQIGDLVLSQDPDSGELTYKPVLQTTTRPPEPLFQVTLATPEREVLVGSGGHPLWASGEGWVLLRDIESGTILHGIEGSVVVSDVDEGPVAETYNLVVDGFHTYVVGKAKIVCHDNTPRRPTDAIVPGLVPR